MHTLGFLALRNLWQHRARTLLSAIAVALGVGMIVATGVVRSGIEDVFTSGDSVKPWVSGMLSITFTTVGFIILAAAGFLILNAFAMGVTQQRQRIGLLRSLGMTRRQILRHVLTEALLTGGLGTLVQGD